MSVIIGSCKPVVTEESSLKPKFQLDLEYSRLPIQLFSAFVAQPLDSSHETLVSRNLQYSSVNILSQVK